MIFNVNLFYEHKLHSRSQNKQAIFCVIVSCTLTASVVLVVPSYRSRGPGSMPGATRFSEK
jgi:hypothetical protein